MSLIPVIHMGLGPIGRGIGKAVAEEGRLVSVAAVEIDPAIIGRHLGDVCDANLLPLKVVESLAAARIPAGAVVLQSTVSRLPAARSQLIAAIAHGYHVVSTCEELAWPWDAHSDLAAEIDQAAKAHEVTVIGVGVNPGFMMDALPVLLGRAATEIEAVSVARTVDLRERRQQLQRKMGVGEEPARVQDLLAEHAIGHVGITESVTMLAAGLGWKLDVIDLDERPIVARTDIDMGNTIIPAGRCIGIRQKAVGLIHGWPRIILTLHMEAGVDGGSRDEILVDGTPSLRLRLDGLQGDLATAALVVNTALRVSDMPRGLQTMLSVPFYYG